MSNSALVFAVAMGTFIAAHQVADHIIQTGDAPFDDQGRGDTYGVEVRGRYELIAPQKLGLTAGTEATYYRTYSKSFTEGNETCMAGGAACVPKNFNIEGVYSEIDGNLTPWLGYTAARHHEAQVLGVSSMVFQPRQCDLRNLRAGRQTEADGKGRGRFHQEQTPDPPG